MSKIHKIVTYLQQFLTDRKRTGKELKKPILKLQNIKWKKVRMKS